jgi:5-(hydroxymethyl)furfural/furfural oxidase
VGVSAPSFSSLQFDYVIVGAGAAGCVMANRLSQRSDCSVLLLEAGEDLVPGREPDDIRSIFPLSAFNERYMWPDTRVHWRRADNSPAVPLPQGRIMGGSSSVMGMWALRGMPEDYDGWASDGAAGWGWKDVLPYFNRLESDQDFKGPLHGDRGPIPIRREPRQKWSPLATAVYFECLRLEIDHIEDSNSDFRDGHCVLPNSRFENSRGASGICYLTAEVRARSNLTVLSKRTVNRILVNQGRATGVSVRRDDGTEEYFGAREVIVTAGALRTPVLLLRSGIGPARQLLDAGIDVILDRPGVGENLQNHAVLYVCGLLNRRGRESSEARPAAATYVRWSSGIPGIAPGDMSMYVRSYLSWHALGRRLASLAPCLQKPASRGRVRLVGNGPGALPCIEFNFLSDERDLVRLVSGMRFATKIFGGEQIKEILGAPFVLTNASRLMKFNRVSSFNALRGWLATAALDLHTGFGLALLKRLAQTKPTTELSGDQELEQFIRQFVTGTGHVCGTCRMGRPDDPNAVCDSSGAVYGIDGLIVGDTSLMPSVPSGNTHIPAVMVAEKISDGIGRRSHSA